MPTEFFEYHWVATVIGAAVCLWISICFILRVWIIHRKAGFIKKLYWSVMLLIPGFGWLAYGALFHPPGFNDTSYGGGREESGSDYGSYHGGGHSGGVHGDGGHGGGH